MIIKIFETLMRRRESFIDYKYDFQVILRYGEHKRDTSHWIEVVCEQEKYFSFCLLYFHSVIMRESTYLTVRDGTASYVCYYSRLLNSCYSLFYSLLLSHYVALLHVQAWCNVAHVTSPLHSQIITDGAWLLTKNKSWIRSFADVFCFQALPP